MKIELSTITLGFLFLLLAQAWGASATECESISIPEKDKTRIGKSFNTIPIHFLENQGQLREDVAYYVQGLEKTLYYTPCQNFILKRASTFENWRVYLLFYHLQSWGKS